MSAYAKTTDHRRQDAARKSEVNLLVHCFSQSLSGKNQYKDVKCRALLVYELVLNRDSKYCKTLRKIIP